MNRLIWILLVTMVLISSGCRKENTQEEETMAYRQIDAAQAKEIMDSENGYIILDVRTREEYDEGHVPGAICIPNEDIGDTGPEILSDKEQLILVYCRSGNRSKKAAEKLVFLGYENVVEFGGIIDWEYETVK